jgi:hypothetical protein
MREKEGRFVLQNNFFFFMLVFLLFLKNALEIEVMDGLIFEFVGL